MSVGLENLCSCRDQGVFWVLGVFVFLLNSLSLSAFSVRVLACCLSLSHNFASATLVDYCTTLKRAGGIICMYVSIVLYLSSSNTSAAFSWSWLVTT